MRTERCRSNWNRHIETGRDARVLRLERNLSTGIREHLTCDGCSIVDLQQFRKLKSNLSVLGRSLCRGCGI